MEHSPVVEPIQIADLETQKKAKRNRRPTVCNDKRRDLRNCGICGSENIVYEGVGFCRVCGAEKEYLTNNYWKLDVGPVCDCKEKWISGIGKMWYSIGRHEVVHCLDCGAVKGPICPACGGPAWGKGLQKFCKRCGFMAYGVASGPLRSKKVGDIQELLHVWMICSENERKARALSAYAVVPSKS